MQTTAEGSLLEEELWKLQEELGPYHVRLEPLLLAIAQDDLACGRVVRARALVRRVVAMGSGRATAGTATIAPDSCANK